MREYYCPLCDGKGWIEEEICPSPISIEPSWIKVECPLCEGDRTLFLTDKEARKLAKIYGDLEEVPQQKSSIVKDIDEIEF